MGRFSPAFEEELGRQIMVAVIAWLGLVVVAAGLAVALALLSRRSAPRWKAPLRVGAVLCGALSLGLLATLLHLTT